MTSTPTTEFGANLRRIRTAQGYTQVEIANKAGVTTNALSQFELGKHLPSVKTLLAIAEALDVSLGVVLGDRLATAEHFADKVRPAIRVLGEQRRYGCRKCGITVRLTTFRGDITW
ncbi:helix-turn-helix domain-containing protein [Actinoplanes lobatus]|uniref:Transcriptional regulator with XRE-family HTH domain n=1 Tax=Actinoplanes lobatus TaxID=113568 RepID=A0A7W7MM87_9ACTN|nr:helix-turn-helix transcriptional regulator [Actinoplanes lobatus]MBB4755313.1 transcriptional regulator with XRE-family HTH domain [Actinoplanes lobatus]GIE46190.1 hypothetical protein Alo02nite_90880 [Actinoplanes lobatus]